MSATKVIMEARAAGIHLSVDGDGLLLKAAAQPSPAILDLLASNKPDIMLLLLQDRDGSPNKNLHGSSAWINTHPPGDLQDGKCAACGNDLRDQFVILGDGASVHYSGTHGERCYRRWQRVRRYEAEQQIFCGDST